MFEKIVRKQSDWNIMFKIVFEYTFETNFVKLRLLNFFQLLDKISTKTEV